MPSVSGRAPSCTRMTALLRMVRPHLVAGSKLAACGDGGVKAFVAGGLGAADGCGGELALGLVLGDEVDVAGGELLELGQLVLIVAFPRGFAFHIRSLHSGIVARRR